MTKFGDTMVYLDALQLKDEMGTFTGRKRIQKTVYLLKQFGADLKFGYSWYWYGPYSAELTRILMEPSGEDVNSNRGMTRAELDVVNKLRNFLGNDLYSVDSLELIVSLIYLIKRGPSSGYDTKQKITQFLREKKPRFSADEIEACWKRVERSGVWDDYLGAISS
jgi:uncharacterized protein YwgA